MWLVWVWPVGEVPGDPTGQPRVGPHVRPAQHPTGKPDPEVNEFSLLDGEGGVIQPFNDSRKQRNKRSKSCP